jgi:hypothetical protein
MGIELKVVVFCKLKLAAIFALLLRVSNAALLDCCSTALAVSKRSRFSCIRFRRKVAPADTFRKEAPPCHSSTPVPHLVSLLHHHFNQRGTKSVVSRAIVHLAGLTERASLLSQKGPEWSEACSDET